MATPTNPFTPIQPGNAPTWGQNPFITAALSGLSQGMAQGVNNAMEMGLRQKELANEAENRNAMLKLYYAPRGQAAEAEGQAAQDRAQTQSTQPMAGTQLVIPNLPQGYSAYANGKGGMEVVKPPTNAAGGNATMNARYKVADNFLNQFSDLLGQVPSSSNPLIAMVEGAGERVGGHLNPSSSSGQLQNFITTSAPSVVSAISNRANQTEINQLMSGLRQVMNMNSDARPEAINRIRTMLHSIIETNPPEGATPQSGGAPGWQGGNTHTYADGTTAVWNGSQWVKQ